MKIILIFILLSIVLESFAQVCSGIGHVCIKTTDCCKGCCSGNTCVEQSFPCGEDLGDNPGGNTCQKHFCPSGQICYLKEFCHTDYPCPLIPACRKAVSDTGYSDKEKDNSTDPINGNARAGCINWITMLIMCILIYLFSVNEN